MANNNERRRPVTTVSARLADGSLVELVHLAESDRTAFAVYRGDQVAIEPAMDTESGDRLVPVPVKNNLIRHGALLLPDAPKPVSSYEALVQAIKTHIYRYVDLSERFLTTAAHYVLLTWVYDAFNELPYLRLRGDFGCGKTRALIVIGSLCHKTFFASGASTVSPIFHTLDAFRGTLILDEADFRFSDEKSELVKILNNGNTKGFPVLRTAITAQKEFDPRAFHVFGPKIVGMRGSFDDPALESRFLTEDMGQRPLRADIPLNLPESQKDEARELRAQLLMYRFQNLDKISTNGQLADDKVSSRMNQIMIPLLSIVESADARREIGEAVRIVDSDVNLQRSASPEAGVLQVLHEQLSDPERASVSVGEVTAAFVKLFAVDYERPITSRYIGSILRKRLRIVTYKSHGLFVIPASERTKVTQLCLSYGVLERAASSE